MFRRKSISEAASTDALEYLLANVSPYIMYTYLLLFHFANICIGIIYFLSVRLTQWMLRFDRVSYFATNTAGYFFRFFVYFVVCTCKYICNWGTDKNLKSLLSHLYVSAFVYRYYSFKYERWQKFSF